MIIKGLHVRALNMASTRGLLAAGHMRIPCSLGRSGRIPLKREGDGATPVGRWKLVKLLYRADKLPPPRSALAMGPIAAGAGWCETVGDRNYNRSVRIPYPSAHETMRRGDELYDYVVVTSHNMRPRVQGGGSAIFFHLRRGDGGPTAGCIAVSRRDMIKVLALCGPKTELVIWSSSGPPPGGGRKLPSRPAHGSPRRR